MAGARNPTDTKHDLQKPSDLIYRNWPSIDPVPISPRSKHSTHFAVYSPNQHRLSPQERSFRKKYWTLNIFEVIYLLYAWVRLLLYKANLSAVLFQLPFEIEHLYLVAVQLIFQI